MCRKQLTKRLSIQLCGQDSIRFSSFRFVCLYIFVIQFSKSTMRLPKLLFCILSKSAWPSILNFKQIVIHIFCFAGVFLVVVSFANSSTTFHPVLHIISPPKSIDFRELEPVNSSSLADFFSVALGYTLPKSHVSLKQFRSQPSPKG